MLCEKLREAAAERAKKLRLSSLPEDFLRTLPEDTMPAIEAELVGGGPWRLAEEHPAELAALVFYRGLHCPICRTWLADLERFLTQFAERGVSVIALSCDTRSRAEQTKNEWRLEALRIGCCVDPEDARKAGLYLSEEKNALFTEPGVLLVKPEDGTLYASWVQSTPYARPHFAEVLAAVDNMIARGLPRPRGGA
jgi:peroxiredoxin